MPALRAGPNGTSRASSDDRPPAPSSSDGGAAAPSSHHRISVSSRGLSGVRWEHAGGATGGGDWTVWSATDSADRLSDGGVPHAAPSGGGPARASTENRNQFGEYPKVLGRGQPSRGRPV